MKLFISYAHNDIAKVEELAGYLRNGSHDAWYDHELLPGQFWKKELKLQVESCDVFVYVVSRDSLNSEWCIREYRIAKKAKMPIIPVLIDKAAVYLMNEELGEIQYSDFCDGFKPDKIAKLMGGLTKIVEELAVKKARESQTKVSQNRNKDDLLASSEFASAIAPLTTQLLKLKETEAKYILNLKEQINEYIKEERWDKVLNKIGDLVAQIGEDEESCTIRGMANTELGNNKEALLDYNKVILYNPQNAIAYFYRGNVYGRLRKYLEALLDYKQGIRLDPSLVGIYNNRGLLYEEMGQQEQALADFNQAITINSKLVIVYNNRGALYAEMGNVDEALSNWNYLLELDPNFAMAYYNMGVIFARIGKQIEALSNYSKSLELMPNYVESLNNRGMMYFEIGKYSEALEDYNRAIEINKFTANTYYNRSMLYYRIKKFEEALWDSKKACEIEPKNSKGFNNQAFLLFQLRRYSEAQVAWQKAIGLEQAESYTFAGYGIVLEQLKQPVEAVKQYRKAINLDKRWNNDLEEIAKKYLWTEAMIGLAKGIIKRL